MFVNQKTYRVRSGAIQTYDLNTLQKSVLLPIGTELIYIKYKTLLPHQVPEGWFLNEKKHYNFHLFELNGNEVLVPLFKYIAKEKDTKEQKNDPFDHAPLLMFEVVL